MTQKYTYFLLFFLCICQYTNVANGQIHDLKFIRDDLKFIRDDQEFLKKWKDHFDQAPLTTKEKVLGGLILLGASVGIACAGHYIYTKAFPSPKK